MLFRSVLTVVVKIVIRADDADIRADLRVVAEIDLPYCLDVASRRVTRARLYTTVNVCCSPNNAGEMTRPIDVAIKPEHLLKEPHPNRDWRLGLTSFI